MIADSCVGYIKKQTSHRLAFGWAAGEVSGTQRLKDVHEGLPASGVQNGSAHMVEGSYDYHHYMQVSHLAKQ